MDTTQLKDRIRQIFEESDSAETKHIRIWPFLAWIFVSMLIGDIFSFFVDESKLVVALITAVFVGAILYVPAKRLVKKH